MPALLPETDALAIAARLANPGMLLVACLCAEWCSTCRNYRAAFDRLADSHPQACFAWIDIETHADRLGDLDVENFPTLLIEDAVATRFFGTVLPQPIVVERMLAQYPALSAPAAAMLPRLRSALAIS